MTSWHVTDLQNATNQKSQESKKCAAMRCLCPSSFWRWVSCKSTFGVKSVSKLTHQLPWDEAVPLLSFKAFIGLITSFEFGLRQGPVRAARGQTL